VEVSIRWERPDTGDAMALIDELDAYLHSLYSPANCYGLSAEQLIRENVAFFVLSVDGVPAGCGGLKFEGTEYAELKRMYVRPAFRRCGLAKQLLRHLEDHALKNGVARIRLETGMYQTEAIALYEMAGYHRTPPFGSFGEDGFSVFFEKRLG
jgi:GNAT superfamily N-acetyltransferase